MALSPTFMRRFAGTMEDDPDNPVDRVEDEVSAGRSGTTPQAPRDNYDPESALYSTVAASRTTPAAPAQAAAPVTQNLSRRPLESQIASDQSEYNRLIAPPPPMTLLQRIGSVLRSAA